MPSAHLELGAETDGSEVEVRRRGAQRKLWQARVLMGGALCLAAIAALSMQTGAESTRNTLAEAGAEGNATAAAADPIDEEAAGACEWPEIPMKVVLKEKFWSFLQTVTVEASEGEDSLGYVQCSAFAWDSEQVWYDSNGNALAFSRHKWAQTSGIFFRDTVHVEDCNKRDMGEISNDLQSSGVSEVTLLTISAPDGKVVATSQSQDADTTVHIIDSDSGKKLATVHKTKGWGPTDSWTLEIDPAAQQSGNVAADPRMLVLALASESAAVAWGFGAAGFICIIAAFVGICACLCIHMMRNADPKDPRFGILAVFDRPGDHYEQLPAGSHQGVGGGIGPGGGSSGSSADPALQGGHRLGYGP